MADIAPDGQPFPSAFGVLDWSQSRRERGSFRRSQIKDYATAVAVVGDDGQAIGADAATLAVENNLLLRRIVLGLQLLTDNELIVE